MYQFSVKISDIVQEHGNEDEEEEDEKEYLTIYDIILNQAREIKLNIDIVEKILNHKTFKKDIINLDYDKKNSILHDINDTLLDSKNSKKDDILQLITRLVTIENLLLNVDGVKNIYDDIKFLKKEINSEFNGIAIDHLLFNISYGRWHIVKIIENDKSLVNKLGIFKYPGTSDVIECTPIFATVFLLKFIKDNHGYYPKMKYF